MSSLEAAKYLGVGKRKLLRWRDSGWFAADHQRAADQSYWYRPATIIALKEEIDEERRVALFDGIGAEWRQTPALLSRIHEVAARHDVEVTSLTDVVQLLDEALSRLGEL